MEDIVGIIVVTAKGNRYGFVTWGRIIDTINDQWLVEMVARKAPTYAGIGHVEAVHVCESLKEVSSGKYFFEALFAFCNARIPFGEGYAQWLKERRKEHAEGTDRLYYLGEL